MNIIRRLTLLGFAFVSACAVKQTPNVPMCEPSKNFDRSRKLDLTAETPLVLV